MGYFGVGDLAAGLGHSSLASSSSSSNSSSTPHHTMSEPDKKDKVKKKKSTTKDKEEVEGLVPPEGERKASLTPERKPSEKEAKSRKGSTADGAEKETKSRKPSSAAIEGGEKEPKSRKPSSAEGAEKETKSRKPSSADGGDKEDKSRKSSQATHTPEAEGEEDDESDGEMPLMPAPDRTWDPNHIPFQAIAEAESKPDKPVEYFQAPPEPDKTDIQLLRDLDTRRLAELMEAFTMFDFDQDGIISEYDLKRTFASLGRPDIEEEELQHMLSEGLNPLDFDAFIVLMGYKSLELDAEEVLTDALKQWDYGTEGLISEDRIRHDLIAFGDRFTPEEAAAALEDAPVVVTKAKERMIDYFKFSNDLCGLRKRMKDYKPRQ